MEIDFRKNEIAFHGTPLTNGVSRGKAYLLKKVDLQKLRYKKRSFELLSSELARLELAITRSKEQISRSMYAIRNRRHETSYQIFLAELQLLNDPAIIATVKETVKSTGWQVETVLAEEIAKMQDQVATSPDQLTIKSLITMQDLYFRLLYKLSLSKDDRIATIMNMPDGSILVADRLSPVEVAVVPSGKVTGILIEESSKHSHSSIMVQTLGVPVIVGFPGIGSLLFDATDVLIDAYNGNVYINPTEVTAEKCKRTEDRHNTAKGSEKPVIDASTIKSADGMLIHLSCNASSLSDIVRTYTNGVKEIGLFRSENHYLADTVPPSAEQEVAYYTGLFGVEGIDSMAVRLLDMGGDKLPVFLRMEEESDPQLGCRGIRFLLSHNNLMKRQIRAILIARGALHIKLLLPFITTVSDMTRAQDIIHEIFQELNLTGDYPAIGIMVEVPSVVLSLEQFLTKIDFVCLGTNDLLQYVFAANREQAGLSDYNSFMHPVFLKLLKGVIVACEKQNTSLTICGEMASDPIGCCLLAALGASSLSIQPNAVPSVHAAIEKIDISKLRDVLPFLYTMESAEEVEGMVRTMLVAITIP